MSNKAAGNAAEREFISLLRESGFWAHKLIENENGAPFDIIACKDGQAYAFEVKEIRHGNLFPLSRIEDNQRTAYKAWSRASNGNYYFAFKTQWEWVLWEAAVVLFAARRGIASIDILDESGLVPVKEVIGA